MTSTLDGLEINTQSVHALLTLFPPQVTLQVPCMPTGSPKLEAGADLVMEELGMQVRDATASDACVLYFPII